MPGSNKIKYSFLVGFALPIFGAFIIYLFASLIFQQQKNSAEASLDYLTSENTKIVEELGDIANISMYRKEYIEMEMVLTDEMNRRNSFLDLLNGTVTNLPGASVIRMINVTNNYVDVELEMTDSGILIEYCQSLKLIGIFCNKKNKLESRLPAIIYSIRLERD